MPEFKSRIVTARKPKPKRASPAQGLKPVASIVEAKSPAQLAKDKRILLLRERGQ